MGLIADFINFISGTISNMISKLPFFSLDFSFLTDAIRILNPYWNIANTIFPISDVFKVLCILISFSVCMTAFYWIQRAINLIRGSG